MYIRRPSPALLTIVVLFSSLIACQGLDSDGESALTSLSRASGGAPYDRFGARLHASLAAERGDDANTIVSPLSAGIAFSLVAGGANGATYDAMARSLGAESLDAEALAQRDLMMLESLSGRKDITLEIANALWVSPSFELQSDYVTKGKHSYQSEVKRVAINTPEGVKEINAWANEKTHGKFPSILDEPVSDTTAVLVTNAVYFRGFWQTAFDIDATSPMDFHPRPGVSESVPGMARTDSLAYLHRDGMQVVRLPYRGGKSSLLVVLPDSGVRIEDIESQLAQRGLPTTLGEYEMRDVHVRLPRVHAVATLDLMPSLKRLGADIAFDCTSADFGAMLVLRAGQHACIGRAMQKVLVDIDEKGTEAAAITTIAMAVDSAAGPQPIQFIVDRPFLFVLRDEVYGAPLFVGRIVHPGTSTVK